MEVTNTFDGGQKSDYSPSNQPQRTYKYCLNGVAISEEGDIFNLNNEKGTTNRVINFPTGFKILGGFVLNTDLIVCLSNPSGPYSQIGIVDASFNYTRVAPNSNTNNDLGFNITKQIDCVARKLFTGDRILYYTDKNVAIGYMNLDNPPTSLVGNISLFPQIDLPIVDFVNISEDGGAVHGGVYHFMARYRTAELNPTAFGFICNQIPMVDEKRSQGRSAYDGAYPDNPSIIGKSINIAVTNIDTDFPYLEIAALRYDGLSNELKVEALPLIEISGNTTISYTYTGDDSNSTYLTADEAVQVPTVYNTAKCIEQKDSRLILSNLGTIAEPENLQSIANDIIIKYRIQELEYVDGFPGTPTGLTFGLARSPYIIEEDQFIIYLKFNEQVDPTTAEDITNYDVNYDPSNSAAYVAGPDYVLDDLVEDSNKIYICIQAAGSGANAPSGTTVDNTWWQYVSPYTINPTSAQIDANDPTIVILTMDSSDAMQAIADGYEITITAVNNFDTSSTIVTTTQTVIFDTGSDDEVDGFFNDYKNEERTYNLKGYQREEVYSFAMGVVFKDGSRSLAYHIPGSDHATLTTTAANTGTKVLGTYVSTADYPSSQGHIGGKVRHHKMPTLIQEPHFRVDADNRTYLRILGVDFTNVSIPSDIQDKIDRVYFVRQSRNNPTNRSILAQGIVNNMQRIATSFDYSNGAVDNASRVYKKTPFFNNTTISQTDATGLPTSRDSAVFEFNTPEANVGAFFSPETILTDKDISEFSKIKNVLVLTGSFTRDFRASQNTNNNALVKQSFQIKRPLIGWVFGNYNNYELPGVQTILDLNQKRFIQPGEKSVISEFFTDYPIDNSISGKFLAIKTSGTIPNGNPNNLNLNLRMNATIEAGQVGQRTQINYDALDGSNIIKNNLFNIYKDNSQQYGLLDSTEYILVHSTSNISSVDHNSIFNGDTFITKFAFGNKDNYEYRALYYTLTAGVPNANYPGNPGKFEPVIPGYPYKGLDLRTLSYYFVESSINTAYRHQFNDGSSSGVKYFPKYSSPDVLLEDPRNGDATSYNMQYSFENSIQKFYSKPSVFTNVNTFETRSIYSEEAKEDDVIDNYRIFLPNSFYDLPKHTGPIWDTFVHANKLYLHTPKCLWRSFFNDIEERANDVGTSILGTGEVFSIPAVPEITSDGGYAGTISQFAGTKTPYGYIFPDALQGKIFLLNDGLVDISAEGESRYIANNIKESLVSGSTYVDNPANPSSYGITAVYDYNMKRFVITKRGATKSFTMSYSFVDPSKRGWTSHHSYQPHMYFSIDDKMFGFNNNSTVVMHEHNVGNYGVYYGAAPADFILEFVINNNPNLMKSIDNMFIYSLVKNGGNLVPLETFKTIRCTTEKEDTGIVNLTCTNLFNDTSNVKWKNDRYQLAIPRHDANSASLFKNKLKGKWMIVRLTYPNTNNYKFLLNFIQSEFRPIAR